MLEVTSYNISLDPFDAIRGTIDFVTDDAGIALELGRSGFREYYPGKVIVKCKHCGQWCARKTACVHCGAPVD